MSEQKRKTANTEIRLKTKPVSKKLPEYAQIKELMVQAFPREELFPMWLLHVLAMRKKIDFLAYYDGETLCGMTYTVLGENMVFVLYLAVNEKIRSKGYGTAILNHLKSIHSGKSISLNVEPLEQRAKNYAQRVRRVEFYKKNGFHHTNYRIADKNGRYLVLSTAKDFSLKDYSALLRAFTLGIFMPKIERDSLEKEE